MGLDVSHDCWSGAYSAFNRWRTELARVAGYAIIREMGAGDQPDLEWDRFALANYQGEWADAPELPSDALVYLLAHSDCDGVIHPPQATALAGRLRELLSLLDASQGSGHIRPHVRGVTERFIAGLEAAAARGEDVEFC